MSKLHDSLQAYLHNALRLKRPFRSAMEAYYRASIARRFSEDLVYIDGSGALHFQIGNSRTAFIAHTDTVHWEGGVNQYLAYDKCGALTSPHAQPHTLKADGDCLGADDGAGCALLMTMMEAGKPGRYIFTTGEEVGGHSAAYIRDNFRTALDDIDRTICFDRAGTADIVTVQAGERLASTEFADALSERLAEQGLLYEESLTGSFTDNALWGELVRENVNASVAYFRQHTLNEYLNLDHLKALLTAVLAIDWESLPTVRHRSVHPGYE